MRVYQDCQRTDDTGPPRTKLTRIAHCRVRVCGCRLDRWKLKAAVLQALSEFIRTGALLLFLCILAGGCRFRQSVPAPSIEFTRVPPATEGGPDRLDIIQGRVIGARPGLQIVLYARSGAWWVQPLANEAFTSIGPDSKWTNSTHVGTEYAALLVEPGYRPAVTTDELPTLGSGVVAAVIAKGGSSGAAISKTLSFSGYEWRIRDAPSSRGGWNNYDASNAWTDSSGALHLRIVKVSGEWTCAEVTLTRSFGYGTYSFVVKDTSNLEPAAVFSMFTWDYAGADPNHREMDIEISRWGDPTSKKAQFVVKPLYVPGNVFRFTVPSGVLTQSFRWEPGRVSYRTTRGSNTGSSAGLVAEHVFTSGVPAHGAESVRINLYVFRGANSPLQNGAEVVVEKFEYLP
jgi:hypothetical protein